MSLPNTYWQLDYIQSSGTQYIDSGYIFTSNNQRVVTKFNPSVIGDYRLCGSFYSSGSNYCGMIIQPRGTKNIEIGSLSWSANITTTANVDYEFDLIANSGNITLVANGTTYTNTYGNTPITNLSHYILGVHYSGSANPASAKMYYYKMYDNDVLVRDFIPSMRKSDNEVGLYDLVNDVFYTNSGTGTFDYGGIVIEGGRALNICCFYPSGNINYWDYNQKNLFDTWERISDVSITKEDEDTNTCYVYSSDGATLRGAYTIQNDGTIVELTTGTSVTNRLGSNKTKFVYDSTNVVLDLVKSELPTLQYNHKISFDISFDGEYAKDDFNLGQPIQFYSTSQNKLYDTILTAWQYSIEENSDVIKSASFTLGKVRNDLTSKLNKKL